MHTIIHVYVSPKKKKKITYMQMRCSGMASHICMAGYVLSPWWYGITFGGFITVETWINCPMLKKIITHHENCIYLISWKEKLERDADLIWCTLHLVEALPKFFARKPYLRWWRIWYKFSQVLARFNFLSPK